MNTITLETRQMSFEDIKPNTDEYKEFFDEKTGYLK